jgi:4,5-DOPA dioxygenase extradiol
MPALFVSHGAPDLLLSDVPARAFLRGLAAALPEPRAIVVASAHWAAETVAVEASAAPRTIHDFAGFDAELHRYAYPARGDPDLARAMVSRLRDAGFAAGTAERGLDHGAWVPLAIAWPDARVPVVQVSLQSRRGPEHHLRLGNALAGLADEGVLVMGSGGATHDLRALQGPGSPAPGWVRAFDDWLVDAVERGDVEALVDYRALAPEAIRNHPSEEHMLPLLVALGAAGAGVRGHVLHRSTTYGVLSMSAFRLDGSAAGSMRQTGR